MHAKVELLQVNFMYTLCLASQYNAQERNSPHLQDV